MARRFYQQLEDAFNRSCARQPCTPLNLRIGQWLAQVRCTGPALYRRLQRPLAHIQAQRVTVAPDFRIDLVDGSIAPMAMPSLPWPPQRLSLEQDTYEYREGSYLFTQHGDVMVTGLDYSQARTIGYVQDPANWPPQHYKQAVFITFYQHLRERSLYLVHASAIGREGQALLIAGRSGAGKTTTMLTCVKAGFDFLGDDTTLLERRPDGVVQVVSLLNTLNVTPKTLEWFPELAPHLSRNAGPGGKRLLMIGDAYPERIAQQGEVRLILAPEVTGRQRTTLERANKVAFLSDVLYYSVDLHEPQSARRHLDFLAGLLETTPSYRLLLGRDRDKLPDILGELLRSAAAAKP